MLLYMTVYREIILVFWRLETAALTKDKWLLARVKAVFKSLRLFWRCMI